MYCKHCGAEIDNDCVICPKCGKQVNAIETKSAPEEDKTDAGLWLLSFLIPIVGLIIFCVNLDKKPKLAKDCGAGALAGFLVGILFCRS